MLIDSHCHLDFPEFNTDREEAIERARQEGIGYIVNIGSSLESSEGSLKLAGHYDFIYAAIGIHPHEADNFDSDSLSRLKELSAQKKVVAIGETGLDYYRGFSSVSKQKELFLALIGLAKEMSLPLVIHSRNAQEDVLRILKQEMPLRGVIHCFAGDENFLKECLAIGFYVSFTCNLTYKKAENLRLLAKQAPLEKILLETDAPFLPPQELRGRRNEPSYVRFLAEELSRIKELDYNKVCELTSDNARRLFSLK